MIFVPNGNLIWRFNAGDIVRSSPAISDGKLVFGCDNGEIYCFADYNPNNTPPDPPTCRYDKTSDELVVSATDPDGDKVRYGVSWKNNQNVDKWSELYDSGEEVRIDCEDRKGTVGVIAEDVYGAQSDWVLQKSKIKTINIFLLFIERLIEHFPILKQKL